MSIQEVLIWTPTILMVTRLTLLLRSRSADQFQVIDGVAAFQIVITGAAFAMALFLSRLDELKAVLFRTPVAGFLSFYAICFLSALWSPVPLFTAYRAVEYLAQTLTIVAALLFSKSLAQAEGRLFTIGVIIVVLNLLASLWTSGGSFSLEWYHSTSYGISAGIPGCYALGEACSRNGKSKWRMLKIAFVFLTLVGLSTSSGSIISVCVAVMVIGFFSRNFLLVTVVLVAGSLLFMLPPDLRSSLLFPNKDASMIETMSGRTTMWQNFLPLISERPILGDGMSVAARLYGSAYNINSHNSLIAALLSTGILGVLPLLAGLATLGWQSIRACLVTRPGSLGCVGALTFALVNSNTFAFFGEDWCVPSVMFVCIMALEVIFVSGAFGQTFHRSPRRFGRFHFPRFRNPVRFDARFFHRAMNPSVGANETSPHAPGDSVIVLEPVAPRGLNSSCAEENENDVMLLLRHATLLGLFVLGCWLGCWCIWRAFPEIVPGALRVYDEKLSTIQRPSLFPLDAQSRILVVGHSYTMTGFEPLAFQSLGSNNCSAFNLGLPVTLFGRRIYRLDEILVMLQKSGNVPTHVLVTWREPWPPAGNQLKPSVWNWITPKCDTALAMQKLFPFKEAGRDGFVFLARACSRGGPVAFRQTCNKELSKMLHNRGYYFMKSDSVYQNDELPADFCARSDSPKLDMSRDVKVWEEFLSGLKKPANGPRILLVPNYYRENSCAPAPDNKPLREALLNYGVEVVGPDYWQYPNHLFSDAAHLNPTGADVYTRDLWNLLKDHLGN